MQLLYISNDKKIILRICAKIHFKGAASVFSQPFEIKSGTKSGAKELPILKFPKAVFKIFKMSVLKTSYRIKEVAERKVKILYNNGANILH